MERVAGNFATLGRGGSVCSKNGEQRMDITAKKLGVLEGERNGYYGGGLFSDYITRRCVFLTREAFI